MKDLQLIRARRAGSFAQQLIKRGVPTESPAKWAARVLVLARYNLLQGSNR